MFVCVSERVRVCALVCLCVCCIDLGRGGYKGEIYMSEQRRIGDREERGEVCAEKKKNVLKEKGKCRKREIYYRVRMEQRM